jgi:hypothetical protein
MPLVYLVLCLTAKHSLGYEESMCCFGRQHKIRGVIYTKIIRLIWRLFG